MSFPVDSIGCQQVRRVIHFAYFHNTSCLDRRNNTLKGRPHRTWDIRLCRDIFVTLKEAKTLKVYMCAIVLIASVNEIVCKLQRYQTPFLQNCSLVTCQQIRCEIAKRAVFISVQSVISNRWCVVCLSNHNKNALVKQFRFSTAFLAGHNPPFAPAKIFRQIDNSSSGIWKIILSWSLLRPLQLARI